MNTNETKTSWFKKNWYLIVIPILCVALIICLAFMVFQNKEETIPTLEPTSELEIEVTEETLEEIGKIVTPTTAPTITHNPTDEVRNLGTNWVYDSTRNMRYNTNYPMYFLVEGQNYKSVQWYIYSDHVSPASAYWGVTNANTKMVSVTPRSDMNGFGVYAVLTDENGNTSTTTMAHMYITTTDLPVTQFYTITCSNCVSNYSTAEAGTCVTITPPSSNYTIDVYNSSGVNIASASNMNNFSFVMPQDHVRVVATLISPVISDHSIQIYDSGEGGYTSSDKYSASEGELITLTLTPTSSQANYVVVTSSGGKMVQHTMNFPYVTFTMPNGDVDVSVTWSLN